MSTEKPVHSSVSEKESSRLPTLDEVMPNFTSRAGDASFIVSFSPHPALSGLSVAQEVDQEWWESFKFHVDQRYGPSAAAKCVRTEKDGLIADAEVFEDVSGTEAGDFTWQFREDLRVYMAEWLKDLEENRKKNNGSG